MKAQTSMRCSKAKGREPDYSEALRRIRETVRFWITTPRGRHSQLRPYIFQQNSITHNYILKQNSIARIQFSRTALRVYISAEQHREYIPQPNSIARIYSSRRASYVRIRTLGVATPGSGDLWDWRPVTNCVTLI